MSTMSFSAYLMSLEIVLRVQERDSYCLWVEGVDGYLRYIYLVNYLSYWNQHLLAEIKNTHTVNLLSLNGVCQK